MNGLQRFLLGMAAVALVGWSAGAGAAGASQKTGKWVVADLPDLGAQTAPERSPEQQPAAPDQQTKPKDLVLRGDAVCTRCHDEGDDFPVLAIAKTPHGTRADPRTPTCTSCHGESQAHIHPPAGGGPRPRPDRTFGRKSPTPVEARNQACLTCHQNSAPMSHWAGSTHQAQNLACTSCHRVHTGTDQVMDKRTQPPVCFTCHKEQRAQIDRPSHHPIPEGKMACSDCHSPMGSVGPHLLKRTTVNDTCYTCHMEKRGPFAHDHEPVSENCVQCHNPHGTVTENLLKMRPPMLCHECHSPHGPQVLVLRNQLPPAARSARRISAPRARTASTTRWRAVA